ncbi:hypothetical protein N7468_005161 [Penicillium chermesinum]|uniref:Uncharacterized protein n=1 Tax=Penicillium chermesinum TaxID=63820 RepID=A0A9W9NYW4_9EURO|nr:uncharacterized protein N7468_005161 [Penicillium chermesinum]KAJ5232205.1 hypothetical protein N7468_005161 [Penicillium chermesinum]KAJ6171867.1 hypothetical protein N7470_000934 [Penicillium chermesinum]
MFHEGRISKIASRVVPLRCLTVVIVIMAVAETLGPAERRAGCEALPNRRIDHAVREQNQGNGLPAFDAARGEMEPKNSIPSKKLVNTVQQSNAVLSIDEAVLTNSDAEPASYALGQGCRLVIDWGGPGWHSDFHGQEERAV